MSDGKGAGKTGAADLEDLARRFQDLWREQMAATAADPEFMEMMGKWMGAFTAGMQPPTMPGGIPGQPGMSPMDPAAWMAVLQAAMTGATAKGAAGERGAAKAGAAPAAAASGAGDVAGDQLERRLADLEQRVARLEAGAGEKGDGPAKGTRRRKS